MTAARLPAIVMLVLLAACSGGGPDACRRADSPVAPRFPRAPPTGLGYAPGPATGSPAATSVGKEAVG